MQIIKGKLKNAQKVVVYGPEGIGKSTFASQFPDPLFSDTEDSTVALDVARFEKPSSWTMLLEQAKYVLTHPDICKTYIIDTADWAENLCIEHICFKYQKTGLEDFGYGNGYVYLKEEFSSLLNLLSKIKDVGINIVLTAHAQMRKFEQPDEMGAYDRWELKLQRKTAPLVKEWADMILFANYKTTVINVDGKGTEKGKNKVQGGKRVMYTSHHPCWDAKNRYGLPESCQFSYSEIAHVLNNESQAKPQEVAEPSPTPTPKMKEDKARTEAKVAETPPKEPAQVLEAKADPPEQPTQEADKDTPLPQKEPPQTPAEDPPDWTNLPEPLKDLMRANRVDAWDIQAAVAKKGYYPVDTPIENYAPEFISGVLVAAWNAVYEVIKEIKKTNMNEIPFN